MRITLTLHELSRSRIGPIMGTGPVIEYRGGTLPVGEEAFIANFGNLNEDRWRIRHSKGDVDHPWIGDYKTADEALAALQQGY